MSEELLVRYCSPTLAGIKTGSLFSCAAPDVAGLYKYIHRLDARLVRKGLRVIPLRVKNGRALIYVYRPRMLLSDLTRDEASRLLSERDYNTLCISDCLAKLMNRLCESDVFPHEIGLFLGYPPEDVCGFIESRRPCKCVGVWKVYGDAEKARKTFAKYKLCTEIYYKRFVMGVSVDKLTVNTSQ